MTLSEVPKEIAGHGLLQGKVVVVTAAAGTGIGIYGANANITIVAAGTGISIAAAGSSGAHNNVQPSLGIMFIIKLLPGG